jgi:magnesium chelatase family protein
MKRQCRCSSRQIENYRQRISGPLLDRIDLHVKVPLVDFRELSSKATTGEKSETIRERVVQARRTQGERFRKSANATNSPMSPRQMKVHCQIDAEATGYLEHAVDEGAPRIRPADVLEALQYRSLDRKLFS